MLCPRSVNASEFVVVRVLHGLRPMSRLAMVGPTQPVVRVDEDQVCVSDCRRGSLHPAQPMVKSSFRTDLDVCEREQLGERLGSGGQHPGGFEGGNGTARGHDPRQTVVEIGVEGPQLSPCSGCGIEVGDVLSVGVVFLIGGQVPDHAETKSRVGIDRFGELTQQPDLQEVSDITRVSILHRRSLPPTRPEGLVASPANERAH